MYLEAYKHAHADVQHTRTDYRVAYNISPWALTQENIMYVSLCFVGTLLHERGVQYKPMGSYSREYYACLFPYVL